MVPALLGNGIGCRGIPVPAECREDSLNLGGNTDGTFALSIVCSGFSFTLHCTRLCTDMDRRMDTVGVKVLYGKRRQGN
ncbi:hypothetical protein B5G27_15005 [Lachnoclostridium sp. An76]|nr:hypothetical protein B5G27_15005 [Lachnoclostridium sp. An76]